MKTQQVAICSEDGHDFLVVFAEILSKGILINPLYFEEVVGYGLRLVILDDTLINIVSNGLIGMLIKL